MLDRRIFIEGLAALAVVALSAALLVRVDAFDLFYEYTRAHEHWELDEYVVALPVLALVLLVFAVLRVQDLRREVARRERAEARTQQALAEAEEMRRLKEDFLTLAAHELRTPLNVMLGTLSALGVGELAAEQRRQLELARFSAATMDQLIEDSLTFARLDTASAPGRNATFAPCALLRQARQALLPLAEDKGLDLPEPDCSDLPGTLFGEEGAVRQIVLNLLGNAIKFTEEGRVALDADYRPLGPDAGTLVLSVADTGPGIPEADRTRIFEPFLQLDTHGTSRAKGLGLGLSLVQRLVRLLGGSVSLSSTVGRGSTFSVELPVGR